MKMTNNNDGKSYRFAHFGALSALRRKRLEHAQELFELRGRGFADVLESSHDLYSEEVGGGERGDVIVIPIRT